MAVEGSRSFSQKKMSFHADMDVLWFNVGELDLYAAEDTVYMIVPMLDNMSEAFDTGNDLFLKAPELSSDINRQWFHDNAGNIIELMQQIQVEETGKTITDVDGTVSREYRVTIPQGTGGFLWELLGMDAPEYDITVSIYLTPRYHMRRIEMDLSDLVEDTTLVVDGEDVGTLILTRRLPENEQAVMTAVRNSDITYTNVITMNLAYYTNTSDVYEADMYLTIDPQEDYTGLKISDITVTKGDATLAEGSFEGTVSKTQDLPDVFADITMDLNTIETIRWEDIRNDTEGFINDMIERAKENM
jgi:hypothetical protein